VKWRGVEDDVRPVARKQEGGVAHLSTQGIAQGTDIEVGRRL
jgi:hypothetical protein